MQALAEREPLLPRHSSEPHHQEDMDAREHLLPAMLKPVIGVLPSTLMTRHVQLLLLWSTPHMPSYGLLQCNIGQIWQRPGSAGCINSSHCLAALW